jgi:hypothetical protein
VNTHCSVEALWEGIFENFLLFIDWMCGENRAMCVDGSRRRVDRLCEPNASHFTFKLSRVRLPP